MSVVAQLGKAIMPSRLNLSRESQLGTCKNKNTLNIEENILI